LTRDRSQKVSIRLVKVCKITVGVCKSSLDAGPDEGLHTVLAVKNLPRAL
jgi:hypothetical protein